MQDNFNYGNLVKSMDRLLTDNCFHELKLGVDPHSPLLKIMQNFHPDNV
jgi:hypothetical protein